MKQKRGINFPLILSEMVQINIGTMGIWVVHRADICVWLSGCFMELCSNPDEKMYPPPSYEIDV